MRLQSLSRIAILGALAFILMLLEVRVPLFPDFLRYDPGDVPAMIATYTLGPGAGVAVQGLKAGLFGIAGRSQQGWIGVGANFLAGTALVLGAGLVHRALTAAGRRGWGWDLISAAVGTAIMAAVLIPVLALTIYPLWGMSGAAAWTAALTISTPFNLFKGMLSTTISLAFYRRLAPMLGVTAVRRTA